MPPFVETWQTVTAIQIEFVMRAVPLQHAAEASTLGATALKTLDERRGLIDRAIIAPVRFYHRFQRLADLWNVCVTTMTYDAWRRIIGVPISYSESVCISAALALVAHKLTTDLTQPPIARAELRMREAFDAADQAIRATTFWAFHDVASGDQ